MIELSLSEIQGIEDSLLSRFADWCDKHGLTYYLAYGTLLGAARHKGFIPWDDDTDVWMPKPDYIRAIELLTCDEFEVIKPMDADSVWPFLKICEKGTVFREYETRVPNRYGVFIDVFPLEPLPPKGQKSFREKKKRLWHQYVHAYVHEHAYRGNAVVRNVKKLYVKALRARSETWYKKKICERAILPAADVGMSVTCIFSPYPFEKESYPIDYFGVGAELEFNSRNYRVPLKWELVLTQLYGDWHVPVKREQPDHGKAWRFVVPR